MPTNQQGKDWFRELTEGSVRQAMAGGQRQRVTSTLRESSRRLQQIQNLGASQHHSPPELHPSPLARIHTQSRTEQELKQLPSPPLIALPKGTAQQDRSPPRLHNREEPDQPLFQPSQAPLKSPAQRQRQWSLTPHWTKLSLVIGLILAVLGTNAMLKRSSVRIPLPTILNHSAAVVRDFAAECVFEFSTRTLTFGDMIDLEPLGRLTSRYQDATQPLPNLQPALNLPASFSGSDVEVALLHVNTHFSELKRAVGLRKPDNVSSALEEFLIVVTAAIDLISAGTANLTANADVINTYNDQRAKNHYSLISPFSWDRFLSFQHSNADQLYKGALKAVEDSLYYCANVDSSITPLQRCCSRHLSTLRKTKESAENMPALIEKHAWPTLKRALASIATDARRLRDNVVDVSRTPAD